MEKIYYVVSNHLAEQPLEIYDLSDAEFIKIAREQDGVYSAEKFVSLLNAGECPVDGGNVSQVRLLTPAN